MADDDKAAGAVWTPVRVAEDLRDTVLGTLSAAAPASRLTMGDLDAPPMWAGRPTTCARPGRQVAAVLGALATAMGAAERAVMDGLFSDAGLADPAAVLASAGISGCRYAFVDAVLRDPRFVAPVLPPSDDVMFGVIGRFMSRLPPDRHRPAQRGPRCGRGEHRGRSPAACHRCRAFTRTWSRAGIRRCWSTRCPAA